MVNVKKVGALSGVGGAGVDAAMSKLIDAGIVQAQKDGRVVDVDTARRIAACLHRGLGGELAQFAGTGRLAHPQAARLELVYSTKDLSAFRRWRVALDRFIASQACRGKVGPGVGGTVGSRDVSAIGLEVDRLITPSPAGMICDPGAVVAYLRTDPADGVRRFGVALQLQLQACRDYVRRCLHRRLVAVFVDQPSSRGLGLKQLVAHLAACRNERVVVHRLDRLPPGSPQARRVAGFGARVLSATECHTRTRQHQIAMNADLADGLGGSDQLTVPKENS